MMMAMSDDDDNELYYVVCTMHDSDNSFLSLLLTTEINLPKQIRPLALSLILIWTIS